MKRRGIFLLILYICLPGIVCSQMIILPGTTMNIAPGSELKILSSSVDTLVLSAGATLINNGKITLSPLTVISEQAGFPVSGTGYEEHSAFYSVPLSNANPGGLGFVMSTGSSTDSLKVKRYHSPLTLGGANSIGRFFSVEPAVNSALSATAVFNYDVTELNSAVPSELLLYRSMDSGVNWNIIPSDPYSFYSQSLPSVIDSFGLFALFPFEIKIDSLNALLFYHGDSIKIYYSITGMLNPGNKLIFEFSDATGSFSAPFILDSIPDNGSGMIAKTVVPALGVGTQYRLRIRTTDISLISADNGADVTIMMPVSVAIDDVVSREVVSIYPNPVKDDLYVKGKDLEQINIFDGLGKVVRSVSAGTSALSIDLSDLSPAVYFVEVRTKHGRSYQRFVKTS